MLATPDLCYTEEMDFPLELLKHWIERHASLDLLCEFDGWPDTRSMEIELQESDSDRLRLVVSLDEVLLDADGSLGSSYRRCGCFELLLDEDGQPDSVILIQVF